MEGSPPLPPRAGGFCLLYHAVYKRERDLGFCTSFSSPEHPGVCPKRAVVQTFVPCNDTCTDDRDCPLRQKCCFTGCSLGCLDSGRGTALPSPSPVARYVLRPTAARAEVLTASAPPAAQPEPSHGGSSRGSLLPPTVRHDRCQLPPEKGPCRARIRRFYYSPSQMTCLRFFYGGCGGNSNNFKSKKECEDACGKVSPGKSPLFSATEPPFWTEGFGGETDGAGKVEGRSLETSQRISGT